MELELKNITVLTIAPKSAYLGITLITYIQELFEQIKNNVKEILLKIRLFGDIFHVHWLKVSILLSYRFFSTWSVDSTQPKWKY